MGHGKDPSHFLTHEVVRSNQLLGETSEADQWNRPWNDFIGSLQWSPVAKDRISRLNQKVDWGLQYSSLCVRHGAKVKGHENCRSLSDKFKSGHVGDPEKKKSRDYHTWIEIKGCKLIAILYSRGCANQWKAGLPYNNADSLTVSAHPHVQSHTST